MVDGSSFSNLNREMSRAIPDPLNIARLADAAAHDLDGWLVKLRYQPLDARRVRVLMQTLAAKGQAAGASNWDHDAQLYLSLAALFNAHDDLRPASFDPRVKSKLETMRQVLNFRPDFDSPIDYDPRRFDGPLNDFLDSLSR